MITLNTFKEMLPILGFKEEKKGVFLKSPVSDWTTTIKVDLNTGELIYPREIQYGDKTTCNLEHNENFVVFECICALLDKGYRPEHIAIEKRWKLGHEEKSGKADICVSDQDGKTLLIIECKTYGQEYTKERKQMLQDGGQLFSYWQQEGSTQWLALYASDFKDGQVVRECEVIRSVDDKNVIELAKKDDSYLLYKNAHSVAELFEAWDETYGKAFLPDVIFSKDSVAYQIGIRPLRSSDLKDFRAEDKIVNRFEEILRHNNVSDKENAFNRLTALFICKLVDEINHANDDEELEFQYKQGSDTYESLQDRLQKLHQKGMEDFMRETIFYVANDYPEKLMAQFAKQKRQAMIEDLRKTIRILKFYSNNDFSFKDVHNEELFLQNGKVLVEVVQLFERYRIVYHSKEQFLGDLFEQLLNKGFKQNEGQFFTPMPITRFIWDSLPLELVIHNSGKYNLPKVIDFACGAGHFLTEAIEAVNAYLDHTNQEGLKKENAWVEKSIFGIEKDYRLARVSKISLFMNGAGDGNIIFGDGLDNYPEKGIEPGSFDILVANPPYSVASFKQHFKPKNNTFELIDRITNTGSEIEVLFVERISQLLKPKGLAAVILPASILSNSSNSYIGARESLLENFRIRAIVQFGSKTFGATNTSTVVLFLEKYDEPPQRKEMVKDSAHAIQSNAEITDWEDQQILNQYLAKIDVSAEDYCQFCAKDQWLDVWRGHSYFGSYVKAYEGLSETRRKKSQKSFKQMTEEKQRQFLQTDFYGFVLKKEHEKLRFFALVYQQTTLVITAPSDNDEQKEFLGYDWSNRKGAEGIQILNPGGKLYCNVDQYAQGNTAAIVRSAFSLPVQPPADLEKYCAWNNLSDMIDFSRVEFNKELNTEVKFSIQSKYPMVLLDKIVKLFRGITYNKSEQSTIPTEYIVLPADNISLDGSLELSKPIYLKSAQNLTEEKRLIENDIFICFSSGSKEHVGKVAYINSNTNYYAGGFMGIIRSTSDLLITKYLFYLLNSSDGRRMVRAQCSGANINNLSNSLGFLSIPLPPIDIQTDIVSECEKIDAECENAKQMIISFNEKIAALYDAISNVHLDTLDNYAFFNVSKTEVGSLSDETLVSFVDMPSVSNKGFIANRQDKTLGSLRKGGFTYFRENDIIIAKITPCMENGKCALATDLKNGIGFGSTEFHTIRCGEKLLPKYLFGFLNREQIRKNAAKVMTGSSGHRRVPISFYERLLIPVIDLKEQQRIADKVQEFEQLIEKNQKILDSASSRKQSLLDKYLK